MKAKTTLASLVCLLLTACSSGQSSNTHKLITLGAFPATKSTATPIPVSIYEEVRITKKVSTEVREDGQTITTTVTEPYRVGIEAVATPVFSPDGTQKMVLDGVYNCPPSPLSIQQIQIHLGRSYSFKLEKEARPGDQLAVRIKDCQTAEHAKGLPVALDIVKSR